MKLSKLEAKDRNKCIESITNGRSKNYKNCNKPNSRIKNNALFIDWHDTNHLKITNIIFINISLNWLLIIFKIVSINYSLCQLQFKTQTKGKSK